MSEKFYETVKAISELRTIKQCINLHESIKKEIFKEDEVKIIYNLLRVVPLTWILFDEQLTELYNLQKQYIREKELNIEITSFMKINNIEKEVTDSYKKGRYDTIEDILKILEKARKQLKDL